MQLTKGAIGNLINRYKAVLKKCHLMNTFGSLAVAGMLIMGGAAAAGAADVALGAGGPYTATDEVNHLMGGGLYKDNKLTADTAVASDITLSVEGGSISEIIGGSYISGTNADYKNATHGTITTIISGETTSAEFVVGGSKLANNDGATLETGTTAVTINGGIFGTEGNNNAYELVMGGNYIKTGTGASGTATTDGSSVIVNGGTFHASVVGGSVAHNYSGAGITNVFDNGNTSVTITGGTFNPSQSSLTDEQGGINLSAAVIGGGLAYGANTSTVLGSKEAPVTSSVTINGGTFKPGANGHYAKIVAGSVVANKGGTAIVHGNTTLAMAGGTAHDDLIGGGMVENAATLPKDSTSSYNLNITGDSSVKVTGGEALGEVIGGNYVNTSTAGLENSAKVANSSVTINGGKFAGVDVSASKAQYIIGGSKTNASWTGNATTLVEGNSSVLIDGDVTIEDGALIGGSQAKAGNGAQSKATATVKGNSSVTVNKGTLAGVIGGGIAETYAQNGTAESNVEGTSSVAINGGKVTVNSIETGAVASNTRKLSAAVVGGGLANDKGSTATVGSTSVTIADGTINGHVVAGGLADGGTATVGTANLTINGGTINGSVYAGGAALNSGTATVENFDVRITGGTITEDVVAGNYTVKTPVTKATVLRAPAGASTAGKGTITIGGDAKIGGKVDASAGGVATNVVIDGNGADVAKGYQGNADSTLTFNNYNANFDNTATGFGTLSVAEGSNVQMDNLSTGTASASDKGFFGGTGGNDVTVNGKGTVKAANVNVSNNTLTVADGSTLDAKALTTATGSTVKTDGLGSTLIIGNAQDALNSINDGSLSSTAGSEIKFTGLGDSVAAAAITSKLDSNNNGIVNVGDTKVGGLSELVVNGEVEYGVWKSRTGGITNNELKKAMLTGVNEEVANTGSFGSAELAASPNTLTVGNSLTLTGLDNSSNFVSTSEGKKADAAIADNAMLTLGDNTYAGDKGIGKIEIGNDATLNVLGQSAAAATVNSGAISATTANKATINAKNVTLNVAGDIGTDTQAIGTITADAANIKASGDVTAANINLAKGGSVTSEKNITVNGSIEDADGTLQAGGNITATDLTQAAGGKLTLRAQQGTIKAANISATNVAAKKLAAGAVAVDGGTLNLTGTGAADASTVDSLKLTNGTQATVADLKLTGTGTITVGTGDDKVGGTTLSAQHIDLAGGKLLVDPAWGQASSNVAVASMGSPAPTTADVIVNGRVGVGQNSYLALGTADTGWLPGVVGNYTKGVGLSETGITAALGVFKGIEIASGEALVVDGSKMDTAPGTGALTTAVTGAVPNSATFAANSLLVVNGAEIYGDKAAITFNPDPTVATGGTLTVSEGAKLLVTDAVAGQTYTIVGNVNNPTTGLAGWKNNGMTSTTDMISLGDAVFTPGSTGTTGTVTTSAVRNDAHTVFPNLSYGMANAVNDLYTGHAGAAGKPRWDYADVNSADMGVRFLSRATDNRFLGMDKEAAAESIESAARIAFAGAVPQMTKMASDAGTNAVVNRLGFADPADGAQAMDADGKIVDRNTTGFALWIAPLWQSQHGWGMDADSMDYGFNGNLGGVSLGADYTFENAIRAGITFNIGGGYAESSGGDLSSTDNRMNFWGLGAYAGWNYENFGVMADVSYTSTWNDLKQDVDSRMGMGDLEADVQATAISAGLRAEYLLQTSAMDIIPHIGVRYMSLNTWGYDVDTHGGTVLEGDSLHQDIWTFPIGVTFSKDIALDSGWNFKPSLDFSVIPAAGDIKAKHDVHFTGLPGTYEVETQMMDYLTWQGGVGLELANDNMSIGVNYTLQAGQHTTGHGVFGSFRYEF